MVAEVPVKWDAETLNARRKQLHRIFITLSLLAIIINLDGGAVPAGLIHIQNTYELSTVEVGLVGMLVYQGVALGCLVVGPLLRVVSPIKALRVTLVLNISATLGFGASINTPMLLVFRTLIGILQAIPAVYFPVWVDEFAPADSTTVWMAVINAGAPLGITFGYVFSGALTASEVGSRCPSEDLTCRWRVPFFLQSVVLIGFSVASFFIPARLFDLGQPQPPADAEQQPALAASPMEPSQAVSDVSSASNSCAEIAGDTERGSTLTSERMSRRSVRARGESLQDALSSYMIEALLPISAARPINAANSEDGEAAGASTDDRKARMEAREARIRRMSLTPKFESERDSAKSASPGPPEPSEQGVDEDGTDVIKPLPKYARFSRATERLSMRGPRLTLADSDGSRTRVVSLLDAFTAPKEQFDMRERSSTMEASQRWSEAKDSERGSAVAVESRPGRWQPTLPTLESVGTIEGGGGDGVGGTSNLEVQLPSDGPAQPMARAPRNPLCELLNNGVYCWTVLSICSLFFVVAGVQFWVTSYIVKVIGKTQEEVTPAFGLTSILAPIIGVFAGGMFIDQIGGYRGEAAMALTLKCCFIFSCCAATSAITCAYIPTQLADDGNADGGFWACIGLIAITLVFGGAIIPAATGCLVAAVPPDLRQISSAASMFCFQQLGYALSPLLSAVVAEAAEPLGLFDRDKELSKFVMTNASTPEALAEAQELWLSAQLEKAKLTLGFQFVMLMGALGVVFLFGAWRCAERRITVERRQTLSDSYASSASMSVSATADAGL